MRSSALAARTSRNRFFDKPFFRIYYRQTSPLTQEMSSSAARTTMRTIARVAVQACASSRSQGFSAFPQAAFSTSTRTSARAKQATWAFASAAAAVALALSSDRVLFESPSSSTQIKRASFADRLKANRGGNLSFQRSHNFADVADEGEEEPEEPEEPEELENSEGKHADGKECETSSSSSSDGVDTIAAVIAEDVALENDQQAAYDPSTGKINWDCPCLGGMAHGPCGNEFKEAFSCFVYSEGEPKGIECVDKFKLMQDCFRRHPEVYKEEIEQEERVGILHLRRSMKPFAHMPISDPSHLVG